MFKPGKSCNPQSFSKHPWSISKPSKQTPDEVAASSHWWEWRFYDLVIMQINRISDSSCKKTSLRISMSQVEAELKLPLVQNSQSRGSAALRQIANCPSNVRWRRVRTDGRLLDTLTEPSSLWSMSPLSLSGTRVDTKMQDLLRPQGANTKSVSIKSFDTSGSITYHVQAQSNDLILVSYLI